MPARPEADYSGSRRGPDFLKLVAARPPASRMDPALAAFFREYLEGVKAIEFRGKLVLNSRFPPWPSAAFDAFPRQYAGIGESGTARRLFSVTLAVTNRCRYRCWHCCNAGRSFADTPLGELQRLAGEPQERGGVMFTLAGGEPLLRPDLEQVVGAFDERACLVLSTTGDGLSSGWALRAWGEPGLGRRGRARPPARAPRRLPHGARGAL